MADRSVAEIIGWEPHTRWGVYFQPGTGRHSGTHPPTVDDLLAWLNHEHGITSIEVYADPAVSAAEVEGWDVYCNHDDGWTNTSGPTLLAALEAAVRSVADAQG